MDGIVLAFGVLLIVGGVIMLIFQGSKDMSKAVSLKKERQEFEDKVRRLTPQYEAMYDEYRKQAPNEIATYLVENTEKNFIICFSKTERIDIALSKDEQKIILINATLPKKHEVDGWGLFAPKPLEIKTQEWDISNILYFKIEGNLQYSSSVSGGGVNVAGALKGAVVAGAAGAIIGSRNAVSTETIEHDNREFIIAFDSGREFRIKENAMKYYDSFTKLIPQKEFSVYMKSTVTEETSEKINTEELAKLKDLLNQGLITQEDYDAKKKQILGL